MKGFAVKEFALWMLILLAAGGMIYLMFQERAANEVATGGEAPPLALLDPQGEVVDIANDRGKIVVLNVYATWCEPCRGEIPEFAAWWSEVQAAGDVKLYGIVYESGAPEEAEGVSRELGINYPILLGTDPVAQRYRLNTYPTTIVIDGEGHLVSRVEGPLNREGLNERVARARAHEH